MFETIYGNSKAKSLLTRLVERGRVPQSLLLTGPEGVGKKRFALEIARGFVCSDSSSALPCGNCPACLRAVEVELPTSAKKEDYEKVIPTAHPDIGLIVPNKNTIYVDAVRDLVREANFRPFEAEARVFIIDEAEKLGLTQRAAANALLKTLEEPAPATYLILVTSKPSALLQTIISRCQRVQFQPLSDTEISELLLEKRELSEDERRLVARLSGGSASKALGFDLEKFKLDRDRMLEVLKSAVKGTALSASLRHSDEITSAKVDNAFESHLSVLSTLVRDTLLIGNELRDEIVNVDLLDELEFVAHGCRTETLSRWLVDIEDLFGSLRFNLNKKINSDALFVRMARM
ncbi:MAG: DNA polymerase III subunit delta' [Pyrinomonadaceae bacterium]